MSYLNHLKYPFTLDIGRSVKHLRFSLEILFFCVTFHTSHWRHFEWFPFPFQKDVHYDVQPYFFASSSFHFKSIERLICITHNAHTFYYSGTNNEMSLWKQSFVLMHSLCEHEGGIFFFMRCNFFSLPHSLSFLLESGLIAKNSSFWFFNLSTASSDTR